MEKFAVIDTETNWQNEVMSVGVVLSCDGAFEKTDGRYYVLTPEYESGGLYEDRLFPELLLHPVLCTRDYAMDDLRDFLLKNEVQSIFAYNARFDFLHLAELADFDWYDIMRLAAYEQFNPRIPEGEECCSSGRLKRNYGVEPVLRMLTGNDYEETHNAVLDAEDELRIMQLLGHPLEKYGIARISGKGET